MARERSQKTAKEAKREKRLVTIFSCMAPEDVTRLNELAKSKSTKPSVVLRDAALWYLDHHEKLDKDRRESALEKRLKKMEDRLANLQVKTALDIGTVFLLMYRNMDMKERDKAVSWAYNGAVQRLRKKFSDGAMELTEKMKEHDPVGSEA